MQSKSDIGHFSELFTEFNARIERDGGFTYRANNQDGNGAQFVSSGFAVSTYKGRERVFPMLPTFLDYANFVNDNVDILSERGACIGAWKDGEKIYLDVSRVVEFEENARILARQHEQIAYYDFANSRAVNVKSDPDKSALIGA